MADAATKLIIDMGSTGVRVLQCVIREGIPVVLDVEAVEYGASLRCGDRESLLRDGLRRVLESGRFRSRSVRICLSGETVFSRPVSLPPISEDVDRIRQIVGYEAKQQIPFPLESVVWDHQLICRSGGDLDVVLAAAKKELVEIVLRVVAEFGIQVRSVDFAAGALYNLARASGIGVRQCEAVLCIGGETSIVLVLDGASFFMRTLPMGGVTVTQALARHFRVSQADAEILKRRHGYVALGGAYEEAESEVAAETAKVCRQVMLRLAGQVKQSVMSWRREEGMHHDAPVALHLCGGAAAMPFLPELLSHRLGYPADLFNPFGIAEVDGSVTIDKVVGSELFFAKAMGVAVRCAVRCPIEIDLLPEAKQVAIRVSRRLPYMAAAAALWIAVLSTLVLLNRQRNQERQQILVTERARAAQLAAVSADLVRVEQQTDALADQKARLDDLISRRDGMSGVLAALESARPAAVEVIRFAPIREAVPPAPEKANGIMFLPSTTLRPKVESHADISGFHIVARVVADRVDPEGVDGMDATRIPKVFLAALKLNPAIDDGSESRITAYSGNQAGQVDFEMKLKLAQTMRLW